MLHVRVTAPSSVADRVLDLIRDDPTVCNVVVLAGSVLEPHSAASTGSLVLFDVARENASDVIDRVRAAGVEASGSVAASDADVLFSDAARRAEQAVPGDPDDAVVWDEIEAKARTDSGRSWSFLTFLLLATLIAGIGRYLDQPILIVGAMVVGPEFAPVSAMCIGIARRMPAVMRSAAVTLGAGIALAAAVATACWALANLFGAIDGGQAAVGPRTQFIVTPDIWSLLIALLAGAAGVLSLTAHKSSALVGVFISVTTVPAVGTIALTVATGLWSEAARSLLQLALNLVGIVVAGTVTLLVQSLLWKRTRVLQPRRRGR